MAYQPMFETPTSYETNGHSTTEFGEAWESEASYSNPELESEWEAYEANQYSNPYANPEYESQWEMQEAYPYANPEYESQWEMQEAYPYANPEYESQWEMQEAYPEYEGDPEFWKKLKRFASKTLAPLAKRFAPMVAKTLGSMIPGIGAIAGPLAGSITNQLLKEGEMEAVQLENSVFGSNEAEAEVADTETGYEAALTEVLASQAAEAVTEGEAEAYMGASLPITIMIMGGRRPLRRVMPTLSKANSVLVKSLWQQGPAGKQLLRTVPTIQRQAVSTLKAAARAGQPITSATAVKALASSAQRVLGSPKRVERAVTRNVVLRQRTAPPNPRRVMARPCPTCGTR